jgi:hypothetical protein
MLAMVYTLALMEHMNPQIIDQLLALSKTESLTLFLVDTLYSTTSGFFVEVPAILSLIGTDSYPSIVQDLDSRIVKPYIPRISGMTARSFSFILDVQCLRLAVDKYPRKA